MFHLSIPISSLAASVAFYENCFGACLARREAGWCDVIFFGHQLTLHECPAQVTPRELRGVRHFGAILDWPRFASARERIEREFPASVSGYVHRDAGSPAEVAKLLVEDPDGHLIELKAYRDIGYVLEGASSNAVAMLRAPSAAP